MSCWESLNVKVGGSNCQGQKAIPSGHRGKRQLCVRPREGRLGRMAEHLRMSTKMPLLPRAENLPRKAIEKWSSVTLPPLPLPLPKEGEPPMPL